jgi:aminoglycoside 6'-N-acetyltransferase
MVPYRFRRFTAADVAIAEKWLWTPEVLRWWGDPVEQIALLKEDLNEPRMRQWIVEYCGRPFAYVQAYEAHAWSQPHLQHLPIGTQVIDAFIGEPHMLGRGHGSVFLRLLATFLIDEGAPAVATDPSVHNVRATRAYARAGFAQIRVVSVKHGAVALMVFRNCAAGRHASTAANNDPSAHRQP